MSRKFVEREGQMWVNKGIVTSEQVGKILDLYEERKRAIGLLPLLGSILVGLGILLFVASNWQGIPEFARIAMILVLMTALYAVGEWFLRKNSTRLGIGFIGIGLISFGAGIILIAQMFHMEPYNILTWIIWGIVGIALTYMYQSRFLFLITTLIFTVAQLNSVQSLNQFSYIGALIMAVGLGAYLLMKRNQVLAWAFAASVFIHSIQLVDQFNLESYWVFIPLLVLYVVGDILKDPRLSLPFQFGSLASLFIYNVILVLSYSPGDYNEFFAPLNEQYGFLIALVVLFAISAYMKIRDKRPLSILEWMIAPYLVFIPNYADLVGVFILFIFALFILWGGYQEQWNFKVNLGTFLFLVSTLTAYGKLTWDFLDRSLFFILGGLLLIGLSWFLNRRRKQFLQETKGA